jgi:long-chain fatty acid transport protein
MARRLGIWILFLPLAAGASGFRVDGQGTLAAGLAEAFVAQADDPSAAFYNPAGLAQLKEGGVLAGTTVYALNELQFQGASPGLAAGTAAAQKSFNELLLHGYYAKPLAPNVVLGLGVVQPFFLNSEWSEAESFAGRHLTTQAQLKVYDVLASVGLRLTKKVNFGFGGFYRTAELNHSRRLETTNPFTGGLVDFASLRIQTDQEAGFGWTAGLLVKASKAVSFGLSYRSAVRFEFAGAGLLTQITTGNSQLDTLLAATNPFDTDLPAATVLELPDTARAGVAIAFGQKAVLEVDADWTGWGGVDSLPLTLPSAASYNQDIPLQLDDTTTLRVGLRLKQLSGTEFRFGYALDPSAQAPAALGPFLADLETNSVTVGWGKDWLGIALGWAQGSEIANRNSPDDFNGTYSGNRWSATVSLEF